jgi:hypothetical protein
MPKALLLLAVILMAGCSHEDREQTSKDAKKLGQDIKRDVKKADEVVTKEMQDARDRVRRDLDTKKDADKK